MTIRPIELQLSIPKTFDASKEQQNNLKRSDINAQHNALTVNEETKKKMNSVNDTEKSEKKDLRNDSSKKDNEKQKSSMDLKEENKTKENNAFCFDPGKIDIII